MTGAFLLTFATIAAGCADQVSTPSQSASAASGNGGASSTASGVGGMGVGGSVVASTSTGTDPFACNDPTVFLDIVGDGANQHFDASCAPQGILNLPGGAKTPAGAGGTLVISSCTTSTSLVLVISGQAPSFPTSIADASMTYYHDGAEYDVSPAASGTLDVFTFEPVGGVIEGAFTVTVASKDPNGSPAKIQISGKFRVCRGPDSVPV